MNSYSATTWCFTITNSVTLIILQWHHNGRDSVSNHQPHDCLLNRLFKENIKAPRHWPLCGEITGDRWIPCTNGQLRGKCFHLMKSSWNTNMRIHVYVKVLLLSNSVRITHILIIYRHICTNVILSHLNERVVRNIAFRDMYHKSLDLTYESIIFWT